MATYLAGKELRRLLYGIHVNRPTAALPAGVAGNIFTVTGGRVLVNLLFGEVTTAIQNQACTLSIGALPTVGTGGATSLATAVSIIAAPIGVHFGANPGGALIVADLATEAGISLAGGFPAIVDTGSITITPSATNTGSVQWDLFYAPVDNGAAVVAA